MNISRKILLIIYAIVVLYVGINYVPVNTKWGFDGTIRTFDMQYVKISELSDYDRILNGTVLRYELVVNRVVYNYALITIIAGTLFLVLGDKKKTNLPKE